MDRFYTSIPGECLRTFAGLLVLLLLFGFSFFHALGKVPLIDPDESRYAEVAREMCESGDFVTPHLNYVVYLEKPPLYYWLTASALKLFGETEFAARFISALSGLASVMMVWYVGLRMFGRREGMLAGLILGTSIGYLVQARLNIIDVFLTCLTTGAMGSFFLASRPDEPHKGRYFYLFYVFSALAVLAKGVIGIMLPGAIIFLYMAFTGRWRLLKEMRLFTGALLFILIVAPWFIMVTVRNPVFPGFFFVHEHLVRYFTTVHGRCQPFWYFIPVVIFGMFPWSCFLPAAAMGIFRERERPGYDCDLFLVIWAGSIFYFFSLSESKLVPYVLPLFPPTALIIGKALSGALNQGFRSVRREAIFISVVCLGGAVGIAFYPFLASKPRIGIAGCEAIALLFLGEALFVNSSRRSANVSWLFLGLCLMTYLQGIAGQRFVVPEVQKKRSIKELALMLKQKAGPADKVFAFAVYTQDLPFYAKRRIVLVGDKNDLSLGYTQGDQSAWFLSYPQFYALWDSQGPLFALMDGRDMGTLKGSVATPVKILGGEGNKLLITNR